MNRSAMTVERRASKFILYVWLPGVGLLFLAGMLGLSARNAFEPILLTWMSFAPLCFGLALVAQAICSLLKKDYAGLIMAVPLAALMLGIGSFVLVGSIHRFTEAN